MLDIPTCWADVVELSAGDTLQSVDESMSTSDKWSDVDDNVPVLR